MNQEMTNSFSWHRFGMVARFYYPRLKLQIMLYPLLSLLSLLLTMAVARYDFMPIGPVTLLGIVLSAALWFGPAIFTYHEGPEVEAMLPANKNEKAIFIMAYSLIAVPVLINLFQWIFSDMIQEMMTGTTFLSKMTEANNGVQVTSTEFEAFMDSLRHNKIIMASSVIISIFPSLVTLYVTMRARYNRIAWSLVWNIVYLVVICIAGVTAGFIDVLNRNISGLFESVSEMPEGSADQLNAILGFASPLCQNVFTAIGIITVAAAVVLLVLTYRSIVKRQVA